MEEEESPSVIEDVEAHASMMTTDRGSNRRRAGNIRYQAHINPFSACGPPKRRLKEEMAAWSGRDQQQKTGLLVVHKKIRKEEDNTTSLVKRTCIVPKPTLLNLLSAEVVHHKVVVREYKGETHKLATQI